MCFSSIKWRSLQSKYLLLCSAEKSMPCRSGIAWESVIFQFWNHYIDLLCYSDLYVIHYSFTIFTVGLWMFLCRYSSNKSLKSRLIKYFVCSCLFCSISSVSHCKLKQHIYFTAITNRLQFSHCLHKCTAYACRNAVSIKAQCDVVAVKLLLCLLQFIYNTEPES